MTRDLKKKKYLLFDLVAQGLSIREACKNLKLSYWEVKELLRLSKKHNHALQKYESDFVKELEKAKTIFILKNLKIIQNAALKNWSAAAWLIERFENQKNKKFSLEISTLNDDASNVSQ